MPKELNGLSNPDIVTLVPHGEEFPRRCGQEDRAVKEVWEGWSPAEHKCDLARGSVHGDFWGIIG